MAEAAGRSGTRAQESAAAAAKPPGQPWRRVVLLGFMGAGKSTVGPLLAEALGWEFRDADAELVRRSGVSVAGWFGRYGEAAFRQEEARITSELFARDHLVVAVGGGWAAMPGALDAVPAGTARVWLRVSAGEALRRLAADPVPRPLLAVADPAETAERLLAERALHYARADCAIDVDGRTPTELTMAIEAWLRTSSW